MSTPIQQNTAALEELLEAAANLPEGGGGGGADLLNENGIIKQQYLPDGFPYKNGKVQAILTDAHPVDMDGMLILLDEVNLSVGEEYAVTWNGVEYKSVCFVYGTPEEYYHVLGNPAAFGGENNNQPFAIAAVPPEFASDDIGFGALLVPLDDSAEITLSISGFVGTIQKIDPVLLPDQESNLIVIPVEIDGQGVNNVSIPMYSAEILKLIQKGKCVVLRFDDTVHNEFSDYKFIHYRNGYATFQNIEMNVGSIWAETIVVANNDATHTEYSFNFAQ